MNINNGVPNGNNMAGVASWHGMYTGEERQKVVQIIMDTLSDLHGTNPNFDFQRLTKMAQDFERIVYEKSPSRDDYLKAIKSKVSQLRLQKQQVSGQAVPPSNQVNQQQRPPPQQMTRNALNANQNMNQMNSQNMQFLQQQAQARSQSQAQIQARQQQLRQMVNNQQNPGMQASRAMGPQANQPQQQQAPTGQPQPNFPQRTDANGNPPSSSEQQVPPQLLQLIRSSPIPPPLLSKIPNLPKGVTTWNQIFDCIKRKVISQDILPLVRDIHSTHMQLVMRQQQQKMNVRNEAKPPNAPPIGDDVLKANQVNRPAGQVNFNNLTPQQRQQLMQRQREAQQRQMSQGGNQPAQAPSQNFTPQGLPQQQGAGAVQQQSQNVAPPQRAPFQQQPQPQPQPQQQHPQQPQQPFDQKPPPFQVTQQDYAKYSNDALTLLNRLQQQKQISGQLDANMKETFIRKYILHQKNQLWKQQIAAQSGPAAMGLQNSQLQTQQSQPQIPQNAPVPMQQNGGVNPQGKQVPRQQQASPMIGASNTPVMKPNMNVQNNLSSPLMNQRGPVMNDPTVPPSRPVQANANASLSSLLPPLTDEAKLRLRQLIEEVSRNNVLLRDVTTLLSAKDKGGVRDAMNRIQEQYGNVDSIISYFYLFTKNIEGTKRLIQMKYMTKNILENLKRGVYLAGPDLLEKLRNQYAKYFDYVKEQINQRRQQLAASGAPPPQQQQQLQPPVPQSQQSQGGQPMMPGGPSSVMDQMFGNPNIQGSPHIFAATMNSASPQLQQGLPPQMPPQQQFANQDIQGLAIGKQPSQQQMQMNQPWSNVPNAGNMMQQQSSPQLAQQNVPQPLPQQRNVVPQTKPKKAPPKKKRNSSVAAATPNAIASSIKTPHNVGTPQIQNSLQSPQIKNTPAPSAPTPKPSAPSSVPPTNAPSTGPSSGATPNSHATPEIDIFSMSNDSVKRRELSLTDPRQFFIESMRKVLELDGQSKDKHVSSAATLCAVSTSFRQVQEIDEICENVF